MIYNKFILSLIIFSNFFSFTNACDLSLYHTPSKWKDETNKDFSLNSMRGKKVVMAMAYTSCQGSCPMIVSKLKKIETMFNQKNIQVEVVVITFDPGFDTSERNFSYYREKMNLKKENWHFLNGTEIETRKMSMLLGIKYSVNPQSKVINHDNKIILISEEGEIEKKLDGLDDDTAKLVN